MLNKLFGKVHWDKPAWLQNKALLKIISIIILLGILATLVFYFVYSKKHEHYVYTAITKPKITPINELTPTLGKKPKELIINFIILSTSA